MISTENAARMCPQCGAGSTVYFTREMKNGNIIRRRQCLECGMRFETVETYFREIPNKSKKKLQKSKYGIQEQEVLIN